MSNMVFTTKYVEEFKHKINEGYIPKRHENPFISGEPDVRRANLSFKWTREEQLEYAKCKFNVHYFAQKYCKIKTSDGSTGNFTYKGREYQRRVLDLISNNRFSILMASRQIGKCLIPNTLVNLRAEKTPVKIHKLYFKELQKRRKLTIYERIKVVLYNILDLLEK